jgi:hypothetical protein
MQRVRFLSQALLLTTAIDAMASNVDNLVTFQIEGALVL